MSAFEKKLVRQFLKAMKKDFDDLHLPQKTRRAIAETSVGLALAKTFALASRTLSAIGAAASDPQTCPVPIGYKLVPTDLSDHPAHGM